MPRRLPSGRRELHLDNVGHDKRELEVVISRDARRAEPKLGFRRRCQAGSGWVGLERAAGSTGSLAFRALDRV